MAMLYHTFLLMTPSILLYFGILILLIHNILRCIIMFDRSFNENFSLFIENSQK